MIEHFDAEAALERIRAARAEAQPAPADDTPNEITEVAALAARMHGRPYDGDPLAAITDRMFRI